MLFFFFFFFFFLFIIGFTKWSKLKAKKSVDSEKSLCLIWSTQFAKVDVVGHQRVDKIANKGDLIHYHFYTQPHDSYRVLRYHVDCHCVRPSVRLSYVRPSVVSFPDDNLSNDQ